MVVSLLPTGAFPPTLTTYFVLGASDYGMRESRSTKLPFQQPQAVADDN